MLTALDMQDEKIWVLAEKLYGCRAEDIPDGTRVRCVHDFNWLDGELPTLFQLGTVIVIPEERDNGCALVEFDNGARNNCGAYQDANDELHRGWWCVTSQIEIEVPA